MGQDVPKRCCENQAPGSAKCRKSKGRTGRSGDRVVDSESQICRQNVVVTPRAEQAEVPTSMACLVLVKKNKKKKERKREPESERARDCGRAVAVVRVSPSPRHTSHCRATGLRLEGSLHHSKTSTESRRLEPGYSKP